MPDMPELQTIHNLKAAVHAALAPNRSTMAAGAQMAPINFAASFDLLDTYLQKLEPVIGTFTPAQYRAVVEGCIALVHSLHGALTPAAS